MVSITKISQSGASPRRRTVHFDGAYDPVVTSRQALEAATIVVGDTFETIDEFSDRLLAVERAAAMQRAFDIISRREVSRAMMERRLRDDGYSSDAVTAVIDRIVDLGYLDDLRFARLVWRAEDGAYRGRSRVVQKLRAAGVDPQVIDAAESECRADGDLRDPLETARVLATRLGAPFSDRSARQTDIRRLVSKGFPLEIAIRACDGSDLDGDLG